MRKTMKMPTILILVIILCFSFQGARNGLKQNPDRSELLPIKGVKHLDTTPHQVLLF